MDLIRNGRDLEQEAVPPAAGRLAELRMPILLLVGSDDTPFIRDIARAIQATSPNVRRVDFPGVGHMINLEARDQFQKSVTDFLNGEPR
jgi:pimeloyl-ACP methyl ester carboxylesterase